MAVMKRGLVLGGAAIAGLLAIAGVAAAASKKEKSGNGEKPSPTGFTGPNKDQCEAWYAERQIAINNMIQLNGSLVDIDAARIEAAQNEDDEQLAILNQQRANIVAARDKFKARADQLAVLMQDCHG